MPDCFLTAIKIHIDDVLKYNTLYIYLYNSIMKHDTLFKHQATNISEGSLSHTHTEVTVGLLINSTMDICVRVAFVLFDFNIKRYTER